MILSMGAKLEIDEDLLNAAEQAASRRGQTVSTFVEQALRDAFVRIEERRLPAGNRQKIELPTFRGQGLRPGVNLDDSAGLLDLMESPHAPD